MIVKHSTVLLTGSDPNRTKSPALSSDYTDSGLKTTFVNEFFHAPEKIENIVGKWKKFVIRKGILLNIHYAI